MRGEPAPHHPALCPYYLTATSVPSDSKSGVICWGFCCCRPPPTQQATSGVRKHFSKEGAHIQPRQRHGQGGGFSRHKAHSSFSSLQGPVPQTPGLSCRAPLASTDRPRGSRQRNSCLGLRTATLELCRAHRAAAPCALASDATQGDGRTNAVMPTIPGPKRSPYSFCGAASSSSDPSSGSCATASSGLGASKATHFSSGASQAL